MRRKPGSTLRWLTSARPAVTDDFRDDVRQKTSKGVMLQVYMVSTVWLLLCVSSNRKFRSRRVWFLYIPTEKGDILYGLYVEMSSVKPRPTRIVPVENSVCELDRESIPQCDPKTVHVFHSQVQWSTTSASTPRRNDSFYTCGRR